MPQYSYEVFRSTPFGAVSSARRWDCRRSCAELELVSSSGITSSRGTSAVHDDDVHVHEARHQITEAIQMRHGVSRAEAARTNEQASAVA